MWPESHWMIRRQGLWESPSLTNSGLRELDTYVYGVSDKTNPVNFKQKNIRM